MDSRLSEAHGFVGSDNMTGIKVGLNVLLGPLSYRSQIGFQC